MYIFSLLRRAFTAGRGVLTGLPADITERDPVELLREWFAAAQRSGIMLPESMCLATSSADGRPSARMVLLKRIDDRSIVFYTSYESRKASELDENPRAAAVLHWTVLQRQIRIEGPVERVEREDSDAYFQSRDRGSQIGAWASRQSHELKDRAELEQRAQDMRRRFEGHTVPLPEFWGGFRIHIQSIEFWQGRANRLHDRMRFNWRNEAWQTKRLYP